MLTVSVLLQDGCLLDCGHLINMPADLLSLNIACLLGMCFSICYTCWYGVSLSAVPAGMEPHYQSCLLAWCFIKGHAFWFGTSLSAIPVGVVANYRPCLVGWCHTVGHVFWCGASLYHACWRGFSLKGHACWSVLHFNRHID